MSVLSCDRKGCRNVMCDRLSHRYGYICNDCFQELVESKKDIEEFMSTEKDFYDGESRYNYDYYNNHFPITG